MSTNLTNEQNKANMKMIYKKKSEGNDIID